MLMSKGADSVIIPRLKDQDQRLKKCNKHIMQYAKEGLRTLVMAKKNIRMDEYIKWNHKFEQASQMVHEREETLNRLYDKIEQEMSLVGATAIEDKL